jgi:hypothetical protein
LKSKKGLKKEREPENWEKDANRLIERRMSLKKPFSHSRKNPYELNIFF